MWGVSLSMLKEKDWNYLNWSYEMVTLTRCLKEREKKNCNSLSQAMFGLQALWPPCLRIFVVEKCSPKACVSNAMDPSLSTAFNSRNS